MRKTKKYFSWILVMLLLVLSVGCTKTPAAAPTTSTPAETEAAQVVETKEKVVLKFIGTESMESYDTDPRVKVYFDAIENFMKDHPNVTIEHESIPHDAYQDKIQVLATANELPDVFDIKGSWNKNFVNNGLVANLSEAIDADADWKSILKMSANRNFMVDGKYYGLSIELGGSTSLIFYNEDIFKECGIESFPKTMTEFKAAIETFKAKGYTPISLGNKGKWVAESCYLSTVGNRMTGVDWTASIVDGTGAKFTDEAFVDSLRFMQDLAKMGAFNSDLNSLDYKQQRVPYYEKKAAMFVEGFWTVNSINSDAPKDVLDATHIANFPDFEKGIGTADMTTGGAGGWAKAISSKLDGAAKEAAIDWLKYYCSETSANVLYSSGTIPAMEAKDYDKSNLSPLQLEYYAFMETIEPCDTYDLIFDPAVESVLESSMQELLIESITPEKMAERIQAEYEKVSQ